MILERALHFSENYAIVSDMKNSAYNSRISRLPHSGERNDEHPVVIRSSLWQKKRAVRFAPALAVRP